MVTDALVESFSSLKSLATGKLSANTGVSRFRDLTIIELIMGIKLIIACDSNASNGEKPNDIHPNPYEESTVSVLKIPLMEVLAAGAIPLIVVDNLCMEMHPTGKRIIEIIKEELERSLPEYSIALTGSTEDNFPTIQSGFGITAIGILDPSFNRLQSTQKGDCIFCVGIPQSGIHIPYSERDPSVAEIRTVYLLSQMKEVHEILPVGSKGVLYEATQLAECVNRNLKIYENLNIDIHTSAGSSTAVLVTAPSSAEPYIRKISGKPVNLVGEII